jgi:hypothetical protein
VSQLEKRQKLLLLWISEWIKVVVVFLATPSRTVHGTLGTQVLDVKPYLDDNRRGDQA